MMKINPQTLFNVTVYWITNSQYYWEKHELKESKIKGVTLVEGKDEKNEKFQFKLENSSNWNSALELKSKYFFSKTKAEKVLDSYNKRYETFNKRMSEERTIRDDNKELIKEKKYTDLVGKEILVKQENNIWKRSVIKHLSVGYKKNVVYFVDTNFSNLYKLSKENKNWKFLK